MNASPKDLTGPCMRQAVAGRGQDAHRLAEFLGQFTGIGAIVEFGIGVDAGLRRDSHYGRESRQK